MAANSRALLTESGLYWLRSRNFLKMKSGLCLPKFYIFVHVDLWEAEHGGGKHLDILYGQTLPLSSGS